MPSRINLTEAQPAICALKISLRLQQGTINPTQYAQNINTIIVSALQVTAHEILGTTAFRGKNAQKEHVAQKGHTDNGSNSGPPLTNASKENRPQHKRLEINSNRPEKRVPFPM